MDNEQLAKLLAQLVERLTRLESRLVRVAMHLGLDANGNRR